MSENKFYKESVKSPEQKNASPSFQRVFKKYHTLNNFQIKEAFHNEEDTSKRSQNLLTKPAEKRHKSYIFNLKDLLMKRRRITITINRDYLISLTRKISQPKIKVNSSPYNMELSLDIGKGFPRKQDFHIPGISYSLLRPELKNLQNNTINDSHLPIIADLDKSLESMALDLESNMNSQVQSPKVAFSPRSNKKDSSFLMGIELPESRIPSMSEFEPSKESSKDIDEKKSNLKKKTIMNILSPVKLVSGIKRFQNQIQENKKRLENKSDINQLYYTPFFFSCFFMGTLRKWRVKFVKNKGFFFSFFQI